MFDTSFSLFLQYLGLHIFLPLISGVLFLRDFYGTKIKGFVLYLVSRFIGVGVVAFSLFNLQFIHFGIGKGEYFLILGILVGIFIGKIFIKKQSFKDYIETLKCKNAYSELKKSFQNLNRGEKIFSIVLGVFSLYFIIITGIFNFNLPTYADDSFGNRNKPAYNIYTDGGVNFFGEENEILGRGRLGYPIYIPIYKSLISQFSGGINDIYFNTRQRLVFAFGLLFLFSITFQRTQNFFQSILPIGLISSLPLVFFHAFEGYMELASIFYVIFSVYYLFVYLEKEDYHFLSLGLLFGFILSYIKNDGFVVYLPGIIIAFSLFLIFQKKFLSMVKGFFKDKNNFFKTIGLFVYFFLPFLIIKGILGLGFNQAAGETSGIGLSSTIHREIFDTFSHLFFNMDNFNLVLIPLAFLFFYGFQKTKVKREENSDPSTLFLLTGIVIFCILIAVFLFTDNYRFVLDQTTVNRVFTTCFVLIFAFSGFLLHDKLEG